MATWPQVVACFVEVLLCTVATGRTAMKSGLGCPGATAAGQFEFFSIHVAILGGLLMRVEFARGIHDTALTHDGPGFRLRHHPVDSVGQRLCIADWYDAAMKSVGHYLAQPSGLKSDDGRAARERFDRHLWLVVLK